VRVERVTPGRPLPVALEGAVLARDLVVAGARWAKGRRLTAADLAALAASPEGPALTILVPEAGDVHEDDAGLRLAAAVAAGEPGLAVRGPVQSRVDLVATVAGVVVVRAAALDRLNRIDSLEVFTVADGRVVSPGDLVASAKVAPHLVAESVLAAGERIALRGGALVVVRPFRPARIAVLVKERIAAEARTRFEASIRTRAGGLGATITRIHYVADDADAVTAALRDAVRGPARASIVLTAGGASTDPGDTFFAAVDALGGRVVRHGAPAHPGSMLWLARVGRTAVLGLPSCGAYSKATAADLLLPLLVAGFPASAATVARLAHGGVLDRTQRYRFPAYAHDLDAPDG
jgi:molybdenum cofactor cytidylyltransferase